MAASNAQNAMKAKDLRPCAMCGQGLMHDGLPLFWRVSLERMAVNVGAVQRAAGMEMMMGGNVALARVFEDPEIARPLNEARTVLICERCAGEQTSIYQLGLPEGDDGKQ